MALSKSLLPGPCTQAIRPHWKRRIMKRGWRKEKEGEEIVTEVNLS